VSEQQPAPYRYESLVPMIAVNLHQSIVDQIEKSHAEELGRLHETLRAAHQLVMANHAKSCDLVLGLAKMQEPTP
jgi:hypothetical protein